MRHLKLVLSLAGLALFLIFVIQNTEAVQVEFLLWSFETRRALLLFIVLAIGIGIGWIMHGWSRRDRRGQRPAKKINEDTWRSGTGHSGAIPVKSSAPDE